MSKKRSQAYLNSITYNHYFNMCYNILLSMFKWNNLPESLSSRYLEICLHKWGTAGITFDKGSGFINCQINPIETYNIYGENTAYQFTSYNGIYVKNIKREDMVLVRNNQSQIPSLFSVKLFCERISQTQRIIDINVNAQKTPYIIACDKESELSAKNMYNQIDDNEYAIYAKKGFIDGSIQVLPTIAPYVADKLNMYKKDIFAELLIFLGINCVDSEKKERMVTAEAESNKELVNNTLNTFLVTRQKACEDFNKMYFNTGVYDKKISVELRDFEMSQRMVGGSTNGEIYNNDAYPETEQV